MDEIQAWFTGRIPAGWFDGPPEVDHDRDEIYVIGTLAEVDLGQGTSDEALVAAREGRIERWREETRRERMRIADEAEARFGRKVAWGARIGDTTRLFTHLAIPAMTRLRLKERRVLDTLVDAGVARSRAHALAWCVRLVADNQTEWIEELRDALVQVEKIRSEGPLSA